jgi:hypothetical protein
MEGKSHNPKIWRKVMKICGLLCNGGKLGTKVVQFEIEQNCDCPKWSSYSSDCPNCHESVLHPL